MRVAHADLNEELTVQWQAHSVLILQMDDKQLEVAHWQPMATRGGWPAASVGEAARNSVMH